MLLVEQNAKLALNVAPHAYVLENGSIVMDDTAEKLRENPDIKDFYLGMTDFGEERVSGTSSTTSGENAGSRNGQTRTVAYQRALNRAQHALFQVADGERPEPGSCLPIRNPPTVCYE